jgi:hypothetical protein
VDSALGASAWTAPMAASILERAGLVLAQARPYELVAFPDQGSVPSAAVLVGQTHDRSVGRDAGGLAGFKPVELGIVIRFHVVDVEPVGREMPLGPENLRSAGSSPDQMLGPPGALERLLPFGPEP